MDGSSYGGCRFGVGAELPVARGVELTGSHALFLRAGSHEVGLPIRRFLPAMKSAGNPMRSESSSAILAFSAAGRRAPWISAPTSRCAANLGLPPRKCPATVRPVGVHLAAGLAAVGGEGRQREHVGQLSTRRLAPSGHREQQHTPWNVRSFAAADDLAGAHRAVALAAEKPRRRLAAVRLQPGP